MRIDLNCDLGEGFSLDPEIIPLISSANIACGGHAGDLTIATRTLTLARDHGVQVGAHPSFLDKDSFGRRELDLPPETVYEQCQAQIAFLQSLAETVGVRVAYLKAHGALYNMACRSETVAEPLVRLAQENGYALLGLPGSKLQTLAKGRIPFIAEGFADRRYQKDGSLVPRDQPRAMIEDADEAVEQARWLITDRGVQTLCVHGDNPHALLFVKTLRAALEKAGHTIQAFTCQ